MKVLVINCGSSSLKYQLIDMSNEDVIAKGKCDKIGLEGSFFEYKTKTVKYSKEVEMPTHVEAIQVLIEGLTDIQTGVVSNMEEINAVGHRVVHGGENFSKAACIDENVMKAIEDCYDLAPLHNPANVIGIKACQKVLPNTPMVAIFDTAFHQTMPKTAYLYGIEYDMYEKYKIRRYGFHGTSHYYVLNRLAEIKGVSAESLSVITCHIGNGASIAAIKNGQCIDTSMGFTPLEGLVMGTRCGDIDPAIVPFIMEKEGMDTKQINDYMNKKCGLLGLTKKTSDIRDIKELINSGDEQALLAVKIFCYKIKKYIGSYMASLNGTDAIIFTAGVGEHNAFIRSFVCENLENIGIEINEEINKNVGDGGPISEGKISKDNSKVEVWVIPTNEELVIARDTKRILESM